MGQPITAEQHNQTRRAQKAKQRAAAKAKAKSRTGPATGSLLADAKRDKRRHEQRKQKQAANEARLFGLLESKGFLMLRMPDFESYAEYGDYDDYDYAVRRYEMDVADLKRACKRDHRRWHWVETDSSVAFAKPQKTKAA